MIDVKPPLDKSQGIAIEATESLPLPGTIRFVRRPSGLFGHHVSSTFVKEGKVYHDAKYLGKVIRQIDERGAVFFSRKNGLFTFTLDNGLEPAPPNMNNLLVPESPSPLVLDFGDAWMIDEIMKRTGLSSVVDSIVPGEEDILHSLIIFKTVCSGSPYCLAQTYVEKSYTRILHPHADVSKQRVSEFLKRLGDEQTYRSFFSNYLTYLSGSKSSDEQISFPILIDSTGLPNEINTHLTAVSNHNGVVNNEIRLIYVVDQKSGLPIFFRYLPGNMIDNSTLITTIDLLKMYNIDIKFIIMDTGYYSRENIKLLIKYNIPFITRMISNTKIYKELTQKYAKNVKENGTITSYRNRGFLGKKIEIQLYDEPFFAYIIYDPKKGADIDNKLILEYINTDDAQESYKNASLDSGIFILISNKDIDLHDIVSFYYYREQIEQVFDVSKNMASLLPLGIHSEEAIRGHLIVSFLSTIVYVTINALLKHSKYSLVNAFFEMQRLRIMLYPQKNLLEVPTKNQKEIAKILSLECPKWVENIKIREAFAGSTEQRKKGRPKGSKNKKAIGISAESPIPQTKRRRGRPIGSKNKVKEG
jgi:hypothetical protein